MKSILLFVMLCTYHLAGAQEVKVITKVRPELRHEAGITLGYVYAESGARRYGLSYRNWFREKLAMSAGLYYQDHQRITHANNQTVLNSDSLNIKYSANTRQSVYAGRFGIDYSPSKYFYLGLNLELGYSRKVKMHEFTATEYDSTAGTWNTCVDCIYDYYGENLYIGEIDASQQANASSVKGTENYDNYICGFSMNIGGTIPFNHQWSLSLQYVPSFLAFIPVEGSATAFRMQQGLELYLRYRF